MQARSQFSITSSFIGCSSLTASIHASIHHPGRTIVLFFFHGCLFWYFTFVESLLMNYNIHLFTLCILLSSLLFIREVLSTGESQVRLPNHFHSWSFCPPSLPRHLSNVQSLECFNRKLIEHYTPLMFLHSLLCCPLYSLACLLGFVAVRHSGLLHLLFDRPLKACVRHSTRHTHAFSLHLGVQYTGNSDAPWPAGFYALYELQCACY
ncbi:hypothetical protein BC629DRAFT_656535 [Irpex lacteus]|nr:hypothetical protein BC629DRAFT_656535 [Irpex lacteus]